MTDIELDNHKVLQQLSLHSSRNETLQNMLDQLRGHFDEI
jgi:hypothetical protein